MKSPTSIFIGVALLIAGGFVLLKGGYITTRREVVDIGGLQITAQERSPIAPWIAGVAIIAGTALVLTGLAKSGGRA
jgi:hypothetical protein